MKQLCFFEEMIIDNFAGGGGASTGIELATGRAVDAAINHDPDAILMHRTNHPQTKALLRKRMGRRPVGGHEGQTCRAGVVLTRLQAFFKGEGQ